MNNQSYLSTYLTADLQSRLAEYLKLRIEVAAYKPAFSSTEKEHEVRLAQKQFNEMNRGMEGLHPGQRAGHRKKLVALMETATTLKEAQSIQKEIAEFDTSAHDMYVTLGRKVKYINNQTAGLLKSEYERELSVLNAFSDRAKALKLEELDLACTPLLGWIDGLRAKIDAQLHRLEYVKSGNASSAPGEMAACLMGGFGTPASSTSLSEAAAMGTHAADPS